METVSVTIITTPHHQVLKERMKKRIRHSAIGMIIRGVLGATQPIITVIKTQEVIPSIAMENKETVVDGQHVIEVAEIESTTTMVATQVVTRRRKRKVIDRLQGLKVLVDHQVGNLMIEVTTTTDPAMATEKKKEETIKMVVKEGTSRKRRTRTKTVSNSKPINNSPTVNSSMHQMHEPQISKINMLIGKRTTILAIITARVMRVAVITKMLIIEQKNEIGNVMNARKTRRKLSKKEEMRTAIPLSCKSIKLLLAMVAIIKSRHLKSAKFKITQKMNKLKKIISKIL